MFPTFANFVTRPPPLLPGYTLCSVIPDGQKEFHGIEVIKIQIIMNDKPARKELINSCFIEGICGEKQQFFVHLHLTTHLYSNNLVLLGNSCRYMYESS